MLLSAFNSLVFEVKRTGVLCLDATAHLNDGFNLRWLPLILFWIFSATAAAQIVKIDTITRWKKEFKTGLNLNQSSFTSNWKAGGTNSLGYTIFLGYRANYKGDNDSWDNEFDFQYGMVNNQGLGNRKTLDRIFVDTKYGRVLNKNWDLALSANLLSQFAPGYKYLKSKSNLDSLVMLSDFFAPAFITVALGAEYHPVSYFKLRLSPIAPRMTIVKDVTRFVNSDNPTPYGVQPGRTIRMQWLAFQIFAGFDKNIAKDVNLKWRYILVGDYQNLSIDQLYHRLDLNLIAKLGRFVNLNFGTILLYDRSQDADVQFSQALSLGMIYTFQNFAVKKENAQ
ncbi:MAG TPA: DUF3078 domain-containing protein [Cyclobacteriaceae bacterium]|nr:DUF3078 domain-containing protein [Cyclobacteriaceae bacterium]